MTTHANQQTGGPPRVAIVGAGPSGCFLALQLRKKVPGVEVALLDTLPTPFGLVRHGIAPDHQGAKTVQQQFDRLFRQPDVHFFGDVEVGRDVTIDQLLATFDAVVLATGMSVDRGLDVTHDVDVIGAGALLRCLNSDPDSQLRSDGATLRDLGEEIALIGTGNVAVDVARLLAKSETELDSSDIDDDALAALRPRPIRAIHVLGRSSADDAKWDPSMLRELGAVASVEMVIDGELVDASTTSPVTRVDVRFHQALASLHPEGSRVRLQTTSSVRPDLAVDLLVDSVISAVGFLHTPQPGHHDLAEGDRSRLFGVGGHASGRLGNLAENRKLAVTVAGAIAQQLSAEGGAARPGVAALRRALTRRHVAFDDWTRIDAAEVERARPGRCRTKFTSRDELLAASLAAPVPPTDPGATP